VTSKHAETRGLTRAMWHFVETGQIIRCVADLAEPCSCSLSPRARLQEYRA
jgi:hypothetical protein